MHRVLNPATGRGDYIRDNCAMQEQTNCIIEDEVMKPVVNRYPLILGEICTFVVADDREGCFTFWAQTFGPPMPLVEGRQVIRKRVRIFTFLQIQALEPALHPERVDELLRNEFAGSGGKKRNSSSLSLAR